MENNNYSELSSKSHRETLADAIAEGIVYLGERGLLPLQEDLPQLTPEAPKKTNKPV